MRLGNEESLKRPPSWIDYIEQDYLKIQRKIQRTETAGDAMLFYGANMVRLLFCKLHVNTRNNYVVAEKNSITLSHI